MRFMKTIAYLKLYIFWKIFLLVKNWNEIIFFTPKTRLSIESYYQAINITLKNQ
jgi:hypothetical protein